MKKISRAPVAHGSSARMKLAPKEKPLAHLSARVDFSQSRTSRAKRALDGLPTHLVGKAEPDHLARSRAAGRSNRSSAPCSSIWRSGVRPPCSHSIPRTAAGAPASRPRSSRAWACEPVSRTSSPSRGGRCYALELKGDRRPSDTRPARCPCGARCGRCDGCGGLWPR